MEAMMKTYEYLICNEFDEDIFNKQCEVLEKRLQKLKKEPLMTDVDGTLLQIYFWNRCKIKVINDVMLGVNIESEIDLEQLFSKQAMAV